MPEAFVRRGQVLGSQRVRKDGSSVAGRPLGQDDSGNDNDGCFSYAGQ